MNITTSLSADQITGLQSLGWSYGMSDSDTVGWWRINYDVMVDGKPTTDYPGSPRWIQDLASVIVRMERGFKATGEEQSDSTVEILDGATGIPMVDRWEKGSPLSPDQVVGLKELGWVYIEIEDGVEGWIKYGERGTRSRECGNHWIRDLRAIRRQTASDQNPKDKVALTKVPMWSLPAIGAVHGAQATGDGIRKGYGPYNWREKPISLMEHLGAIERHVACIKDGEDYCRDSRVSHLGCINAGTAIILDATQCNTLIDDRPKKPGRTAVELETYRAKNSEG